MLCRDSYQRHDTERKIEKEKERWVEQKEKRGRERIERGGRKQERGPRHMSSTLRGSSSIWSVPERSGTDQAV